jgi:hypothetical protein
MSAIAIELKLPSQQYEILAAAARARQLPVAELAQAALADWLERQARLEHARMLMRELGQGLGQGLLPDAARRHDDILYTRERV